MTEMNVRGFMVTARIVKKRWFREPAIEIQITDGANTLTYRQNGIFMVESDKPLNEPILLKEEQIRGLYAMVLGFNSQG